MKQEIIAPNEGWIEKLDAGSIGEAAVILGAGREKKGDPIDPAVGIILQVKVGDKVTKGQSIMTLFGNSEELLLQARQMLMNAITINDSPVNPLPLFYGMVSHLSIE